MAIKKVCSPGYFWDRQTDRHTEIDRRTETVLVQIRFDFDSTAVRLSKAIKVAVT